MNQNDDDHAEFVLAQINQTLVQEIARLNKLLFVADYLLSCAEASQDLEEATAEDWDSQVDKFRAALRALPEESAGDLGNVFGPQTDEEMAEILEPVSASNSSTEESVK